MTKKADIQDVIKNLNGRIPTEVLEKELPKVSIEFLDYLKKV